MKLFDPEVAQPLQLRPECRPVPPVVEVGVVGQRGEGLAGEGVLLLTQMDQHDSDIESPDTSQQSAVRENRIFVS